MSRHSNGRLPVALSIAGSDPSGGAGIQADLKTFHQFGVYGQAAITLLTVQNSTSVRRVETLDPALVLEQIEAAISDIPPAAAKTGALGTEAVVRAIARAANDWSFPLVVDPVMISKHGAPLIAEEACDALAAALLPCARLITPNLHEAAALARMSGPIDTLDGMKAAAVRIAALGAKAVLVKGGHLAGDAVDLLFADGDFTELSAPRIDTPNTHGTGCTYSAAITAGLAHGQALLDAVRAAKSYVQAAIATNPGLGHGAGPVNHHARI
jgi:hydroxymethylpyrimidine/phosphomethylpyrimidine kinase